MKFKFKPHDYVKILIEPDLEYTEFKEEPVKIKKGMKGKINIILSNGNYHVEILNNEGEVIAYAPFDEESLEAF